LKEKNQHSQQRPPESDPHPPPGKRLREGKDKIIPEDFEYLINLGVSREQWGSLHGHFGEDASHRPHINSGGIVARAE
jgi:hypothetical protein